MMQQGHVIHVPEKATTRWQSQGVDMPLERRPKAAIAGDDQLCGRDGRRDGGEAGDQQVKILLRLEPADGSDHIVRRGEAESPTRFCFARGIPSKRDRVDSVEDDSDARRVRSGAYELVAYIARHRNDVGESCEY